MDRKDALKSLFDPSGCGLEIGPSDNPLLRKSDGYRIEIADYADAAALRRIHPGKELEEVDYVTDGKPFTSVIDKREATLREMHVVPVP